MNDKHFRLITFSLEHLIFPFIFMLFAAMMAVSFMDEISVRQPLDLVQFARLTRYIFLFFFNILIAYFLYMTRNGTKVYPDSYMEVFVPILATFWFFSYSLVEMIPHHLNPVVLPAELITLALPAGIMVNLVGHGIAIGGVLSLKQSFGILIKVNEIITSGLYGVVRHPIYFGYLMVTIGFMLMTPRLIHEVVYVLAILLQVWRAKVEENKLAAVSAEYRHYMQKVPFLVPDFLKLCGLKK